MNLSQSWNICIKNVLWCSSKAWCKAHIPLLSHTILCFFFPIFIFQELKEVKLNRPCCPPTPTLEQYVRGRYFMTELSKMSKKRSSQLSNM